MEETKKKTAKAPKAEKTKPEEKKSPQKEKTAKAATASQTTLKQQKKATAEKTAAKKTVAKKTATKKTTEPKAEKNVTTPKKADKPNPAKKQTAKKQAGKQAQQKQTVSTSATEKEVKKSALKDEQVSQKEVEIAEKTPKNSKKSAKKPQKTNKTVQNAPKSVEKEPQKLVGFHGLNLNTYVYDDVKSPKAVVVIVHGMMEHAHRYKDFAQFLNKNGYIVIANDLRGHGHTAESMSRLGFGEEDIFQETLKDELLVISYASTQYNLPIYVFGHSYGSMISQVLVQMSQQIEKCVISGTTNGDALNMRAGAALAHILSPFKRSDSPGGMIEKIVIKSFEKGFDRGNWLSRDEATFDAYNSDEYCGGSFPFSFYKSLMLNMAKANSGIDKIGRKKLLLIVGDQDPVGQKSKQVKKLYNLYLEHNIDAKLKVYPGARHELINETNKEEVYRDILNFFDE